jgi:hypothetical protein
MSRKAARFESLNARVAFMTTVLREVEAAARRHD